MKLGVDVNMNRLRLIFYILATAGVLSPVFAQTNSAITALTSQLCQIVAGVRLIVGIIALVLFILGGVIYAVSHFLPTNVEFRKSMGGWGTAMIIGGIVGLIIVIIAQPIVQLVTGFSPAFGGSSITVSC